VYRRRVQERTRVAICANFDKWEGLVRGLYVGAGILDDILGPLFKLGEWRVLVLDQLSTSIVSSCCRMHDVMSKGITLVEGLEKSKEPQLAREAIYIMWPSEESLTKMLMDFDESFRVYKAAHVFLLDRMKLNCHNYCYNTKLNFLSCQVCLQCW
jgi:hypothetical protein